MMSNALCDKTATLSRDELADVILYATHSPCVWAIFHALLPHLWCKSNFSFLEGASHPDEFNGMTVRVITEFLNEFLKQDTKSLSNGAIISGVFYPVID